jgi:hypothetical protein
MTAVLSLLAGRLSQKARMEALGEPRETLLEPREALGEPCSALLEPREAFKFFPCLPLYSALYVPAPCGIWWP